MYAPLFAAGQNGACIERTHPCISLVMIFPLTPDNGLAATRSSHPGAIQARFVAGSVAATTVADPSEAEWRPHGSLTQVTIPCRLLNRRTDILV